MDGCDRLRVVQWSLCKELCVTIRSAAQVRFLSPWSLVETLWRPLWRLPPAACRLPPSSFSPALCPRPTRGRRGARRGVLHFLPSAACSACLLKSGTAMDQSPLSIRPKISSSHQKSTSPSSGALGLIYSCGSTPAMEIRLLFVAPSIWRRFKGL